MAKMGQSPARWGQAAQAMILFAPVIDGDVLPCTPWQGINGRVDLMVGHTRDEQRLLSALSGVLGTVSQEQADETAHAFAPDPRRYQTLYPDPEKLYEVVRSDWLFRMPSLHLAQASYGPQMTRPCTSCSTRLRPCPTH